MCTVRKTEFLIFVKLIRYLTDTLYHARAKH